MLSITFFCLCIKNNNRANNLLYEEHKNKSNKTYTPIEATSQSTVQLNKLDNNKDKIDAITKDLTSIENKQDVYKIKKDKEFEELLNSLIEIVVEKSTVLVSKLDISEIPELKISKAPRDEDKAKLLCDFIVIDVETTGLSPKKTNY